MTLSSFRGQESVLRAFFPFAFSNVCPSEFRAFGEDFDAFSAAEVEILPISVDAAPSVIDFQTKYDMKVELRSERSPPDFDERMRKCFRPSIM